MDPMSTTPDRIRFAEPEERLALEGLQRRSSLVWEEYREALLAHPDAIEIPEELVQRVRVVSIAGKVVGFHLVLTPHDGACEVDGLFVEPDQMRTGVGRLLVRDASERALEEGATALEVTANPRALAFYEKVGFVAVGQVETRFGPGIRMRLPLR